MRNISKLIGEYEGVISDKHSGHALVEDGLVIVILLLIILWIGGILK